jgi:hypothetical protein
MLAERYGISESSVSGSYANMGHPSWRVRYPDLLHRWATP